jgi:muramidase (phage lysozyme)
MSYLDDPDVQAFAPTSDKLGKELENPNVRKYLSYLNANEGSPKANQTVGYKEFNDLSKHPNIAVPFNKKGDVSTAAGKYQFLNTTWNDVSKKHNLKDFSEENQDKGAVALLQDINALEDVKKGNFSKANEKAKNIWASLPGSTIGAATGQKTNKADQYSHILKGYESDPDVMAFSTKPTETKSTTTKEKPKSFVEEVKKPFETFGLEEFQKESIIYNIAQLTNPLQAAEATKNLYEKGKNIVTGLGNLVENPKETLINAYKEITENPGKFVGQTIKGIIYDPETLLPIGGVAKVSKPVSQQMAERGSVGAAGVTNKMTLQAAMDIASPELKRDLAEKFAKGDTALLNEKALNNVLEADQLPIPIRLTEGQAAENPTLISRERNERGFKEQYVQRFNEQNKLLGENAVAIKEKVSPNINTTDFVADAQELIDAISKKKQANVKATQDAYKALEKASGGKFPIDGKTFADNAIAVLNKEDRFDYLPSTMQKKLNDYASGKKEMNFNLFENLRTDLAAEIRKAQRSGDGNQAYVLGQVRNELENLPLKGEAANLKPLADKARATAKADFDLEKSNVAYSRVVNDIADSKNFVEDAVIRSKNKDFANTLNLISDNPQALEHLRSGTLDYIINKSKDASGNFSTGQFNKYINNLDVNKKLFALFGEDAEVIRNLARTGQRIEARPKGSFVNESNTATALGSFAKQYAGRLLENIPGAKTVAAPYNIAKEVIEERKAKKQVAESLKPGAGTKLKDIGKK